MAPGAPVIHPEKPRYAGNINTRVDWDFGDVEKGFAEADHVREQRFVGNRTYQAPMEPHAALARWEHHGDRLTHLDVDADAALPAPFAVADARHPDGKHPRDPARGRRRVRRQGRGDAARLLRGDLRAADRPAGDDGVLARGDVPPLPRAAQAVHRPQDRREEGRDDHRRRAAASCSTAAPTRRSA